MIQTEAIIQSAVGLHARPAKELVNLVKKFSSSVTLKFGEASADAQSMLQVMKLAIPQGGKVNVCVDGDDADSASKEVTNFLNTFVD